MTDSTLPGVSFVVTLYNKEAHIERTLRSCIDQEGDFQREYIVVDDGSSDRSVEIAQQVLSGIPDSKIITQANSGPARAFNVGAAAARMPYIKPMDGDDILLPDAVVRLMQGVSENNVALVTGQKTEDTLLTPEQRVRASERVDYTKHADPLAYCIRHSLATTSSCLVSREAFIDVGGCDETVFIQDQSFVARLATKYDILETDEFMAVTPHPGELWFNRAQTLHDNNATLCGILRDNPDLPLRYKRLALKKCAGRSWKWDRRMNKKRWFISTMLWINLLSYAPCLPGYERLMRKTCETYRENFKIRLPALESTWQGPTFG